MVVAPSISLSSLPSIILLSKSHHFSFNAHPPVLALPSIARTTHKYSTILRNPTRIWRISAAAPPANSLLLLSEAAAADPIAATEQLVTTSDDGVSTIISALLFIAFIGLSILTIGVIYIAVTDFLQKREREKFEKGEAAKAKKSGKKKKVRARAGPKGFGQKVDEADIDDI